MSSRLRRSLLLTTLLALLLGVSGAAALIGLAANPPDTKVAGIDVDATTIPELQELMNANRLKSVAADAVLPAPHPASSTRPSTR